MVCIAVCAIYIAHRDKNIKLKEGLLKLYKGGTAGKGALPNGGSLTVEDIRCPGCLSDDRFMHCHQCEIKKCTEEKGYAGCHQYSDFPCQYDEKWVRDEEARYVCPECGNKVFRGAMKCNQCKAQLDLD